MISRAQVQPYIGQHVVVHTRQGTVHHGILHTATNDGIYLRQLQGRAGLVQGQSSANPELLGQLPTSDADMTEAWWPFFFLPWFALAAFYPWGLYW